MPIPDEFESIIQLLEAATSQRRVNWAERSGAVAVKFKRFDVEIWHGQDGMFTSFVGFAMKDPDDGQIIESWTVEEGESDYERLLAVFKTARRHALDVDAKVNELKRELLTGGKVGIEDEWS